MEQTRCRFCEKPRTRIYWGGICGYCRRKHMGRDRRVDDAVLLAAVNGALSFQPITEGSK